MNQNQLDDVKSHDVQEGFLGGAEIRAQSKRLDDGLYGIKDLYKTNKCYGIFGMDLNDGKGPKYEAEYYEFNMDCDKTRGRFWQEGIDESDLSINYGRWGGFGDSAGWKGIQRVIPPPSRSLFEFDRGTFAQGVRGIIDPFDPENPYGPATLQNLSESDMRALQEDLKTMSLVSTAIGTQNNSHLVDINVSVIGPANDMTIMSDDSHDASFM